MAKPLSVLVLTDYSFYSDRFSFTMT